MKKFIFSSALIFSISTQLLFAQKLPNKKEVLKVLKSTNAYFMNKWPDAGKSIVTNRERPSNIWTRAVYYEGLMNLYKINPEKAYYDYAVQWGEKHHWGLRNGIATKNADDQACGQTYIDLYLIDKQPERIKDIKASIDLVIQSGKVNDWTWIDAIQMGMPVFAKLGKLYNDTTYYNYMPNCTQRIYNSGSA
jgi:unsaturated rhamnogalacturonyl hydrolase